MNSRFGIINRLRSAFNVFLDRDKRDELYYYPGSVSSRPQHKTSIISTNDKSFIQGLFNRISIDVSAMKMAHARLDENGRFSETIQSKLHRCLTVEANIDQNARAFMQDVVLSMFDEGVVAIVPVDTTTDYTRNNAYDIVSMRTGKIVQWYPHKVMVRVYNDNTGIKEDITLPKSKVAIIENPLYSIMNDPNSIIKRLVGKLNLLDVIDQQSGSGKLDMIIQLPYVIKSEARKKQADARREELYNQLQDSKYGVAYADGTEKVIQLNRPIENNLMVQIEYLTRMAYAQLGVSEAILAGTADEKEIINYYNRTVEPIITTIASEMSRKFLTKTAQSQNQSITYFRDLFAIVTPERLADLADKLTRNEIAAPNDLRAVIGWMPSKDKEADKLRNRNLNQSNESKEPAVQMEPETTE